MEFDASDTNVERSGGCRLFVMMTYAGHMCHQHLKLQYSGVRALPDSWGETVNGIVFCRNSSNLMPCRVDDAQGVSREWAECITAVKSRLQRKQIKFSIFR